MIIKNGEAGGNRRFAPFELVMYAKDDWGNCLEPAIIGNKIKGVAENAEIKIGKFILFALLRFGADHQDCSDRWFIFGPGQDARQDVRHLFSFEFGLALFQESVYTFAVVRGPGRLLLKEVFDFQLLFK